MSATTKIRCLKNFSAPSPEHGGKMWTHNKGSVITINTSTNRQKEDLMARVAAGHLEIYKEPARRGPGRPRTSPTTEV